MQALFTSFFNLLLALVFLYKYWGLFIIALLSSLLLPIPASSILAAAAAFASQGFLNLYLILFVTLAGSIMGDVLGYAIARVYGEKVLLKLGFKRLMHSSAYERAENYIRDFAPSLVFWSRFLTEVSPAVNIIAGLSKVPYMTFGVFALLGETGYTLIYGLAGYFLGNQWENNIYFFVKSGLVLLFLGLTVSLIQVAIYKRKRKI